jgi:hypothetical protein
VAVITAGELEDLAAPGHAPNQSQGGHRRLGARGDEPDPLDIRHHAHHDPGQLDLELARRPEGGSRGSRIVYRRDDLRMGVPEQEGAPTLHEIDVGVSVDVGDERAGRALHEERGSSDGIERPHGRGHAAGHQRAGVGKQLVGALAA